MKRLVVTRADDNIKEMTDITLPVMRKYAARCGADFKILSHEPPFLTSDHKTHYRILAVSDLLDEYDRILCLDADMIINKNCPNLFDIVPEDKIGVIYEDKGSRAADRKSKIQNIQRVWGDVGWKHGYTNAGTFLLSKQHKDIFLPHNGEYWLEWGSADLHMSYNIHKFNFEVFELDYKWNHMTMMSEPWNGNPNRFDSYIIHYAGVGKFDRGVNTRTEQIKSDYEKIYGSLRTDIEWFFNCLENNIPFGFARFNDGEMMAIESANSVVSRGDQVVNESLSKKLKECIQHRQLNYFTGVPCSMCYPGHSRLAEQLVGDYEHKVLAVSNINKNWVSFSNRLFKFLKGKEIIWISGDDQDISFFNRNGIKVKKHIVAPTKNAWSFYDELMEERHQFMEYDIVFLSLGPTGRVLVKEFFEHQPLATFIDIGSCFDPFTRNVSHRYHNDSLPACSECN